MYTEKDFVDWYATNLQGLVAHLQKSNLDSDYLFQLVVKLADLFAAQREYMSEGKELSVIRLLSAYKGLRMALNLLSSDLLLEFAVNQNLGDYSDCHGY